VPLLLSQCRERAARKHTIPPGTQVHPLAVQSSVLPLDWLTGSFDLHVACAADISARPVNAQLQCSAQLHRVQAVVPPGMVRGLSAYAVIMT
jgi:hypothetical protein